MCCEWQNIETAPRDGTAIWTVGSIYGKPFQYECNWNGVEWYHGFGDSWVMLSPTHWQPLPPAPTGAAEEKGQGS